MKEFKSDFMRAWIRSYNQYDRFEFFEFQIDLSKGKHMLYDKVAEVSFEDDDLKKQYYGEIEGYFLNDAQYRTKYNLEIYGDLVRIRKQFLPGINRMNDFKRNHDNISLTEIAFYNIDENKRNSLRLVWEENRCLPTFRGKPLLIVSEHYQQLELMLRYLEKIGAAHSISVLVKVHEVINEPTYEELLHLVRRFDKLEIDIQLDQSDEPYINPAHPSFGQHERLTILLGELSLYRVNDIPGDKLIIGNALNPYSQGFTNLFEVYGDGVHPFLAYIKKNEFAYKNCTMVEKGAYSLYHYAHQLHENDKRLASNYYEYDMQHTPSLPSQISLYHRANPPLQYAKAVIHPKELQHVTFVSPYQTQKDLVYPRAYFKNKSGDYVYLNGLYFYTEKLRDEYNAGISPKEKKLTLKNFYMDYLYYQEGIELPPLFNKAFVGITRDGDVIAGNRVINKAKIKLLNSTYELEESQINPMDGEQAVFLMTPFDGNSAEKMKNRYNLVFINNVLQDFFYGTRTVPPPAIVLSFKYFDFNLISEMATVSMHMEIDYPKDIPKSTWDQVVVAAGGGTFLYKNGENLVETYAKQLSNFENEGWLHENSLKSQETIVHEFKKGPRSVIGKTLAGEILLYSFSGRIKESEGARFDEVVGHVLREHQDLDWLVNLDGGASSCLGYASQGVFTELNIPCASKYNATGMVRPVNSFFVFQLKCNEENKK